MPHWSESPRKTYVSPTLEDSFTTMKEYASFLLPYFGAIGNYSGDSTYTVHIWFPQSVLRRSHAHLLRPGYLANAIL